MIFLINQSIKIWIFNVEKLHLTNRFHDWRAGAPPPLPPSSFLSYIRLARIEQWTKFNEFIKREGEGGEGGKERGGGGSPKYILEQTPSVQLTQTLSNRRS